jgi:hypothetical protein
VTDCAGEYSGDHGGLVIDDRTMTAGDYILEDNDDGLLIVKYSREEEAKLSPSAT